MFLRGNAYADSVRIFLKTREKAEVETATENKQQTEVATTREKIRSEQQPILTPVPEEKLVEEIKEEYSVDSIKFFDKDGNQINFIEEYQRFNLKFETTNCEEVKYEIKKISSFNPLGLGWFDTLISSKTIGKNDETLIPGSLSEGNYYVLASCVDTSNKEISKEERKDFEVKKPESKAVTARNQD